MAINKVNKNLNKIKASIKKIKAGNTSVKWDSLISQYVVIASLAGENDWPEINDAAALAEKLAQMMSTGETHDIEQAFKYLHSLNLSIGKLIKDIKKNGQITISIKGPLSEAKLFLGDFDFTSDDSSEEEEDPLDFDDIDVFDELKKRVISIENLVLGLNEDSYDEEAIKSIFRDYHTLKGEAGFSGLAELSEFCHKVESAIEPIREKELKLTKEITDIMLYFVDTCKSYIESSQQSTPAPEVEEIELQIEAIKSLIENPVGPDTVSKSVEQPETVPVQNEELEIVEDTVEITSLDVVNENLNNIKASIKEIPAGNTSVNWDALISQYMEIVSMSGDNDWTVMNEAAVLAEKLARTMSTGETYDIEQASKYINSLNSSIENLIDDIKKNGQITISIKGPLSEAKLFLGDFDFTSDDSSEEEEDSLEFDDIDVFDELKKRVVSIENLVLGLSEDSYDEEAIKSIFRDYHTLKGEAGFSGLAELSEFCHKVESAIEPIREKQLQVTKEITDIMLYFVDTCKSYIESSQQSTPAPDEEEIELQIEAIKSLIENPVGPDTVLKSVEQPETVPVQDEKLEIVEDTGEITTLNEVNEIINNINGLIEKDRSGDTTADWDPLISSYEKINIFAGNNDWTSINDASVLAGSLVKKISSGDIYDIEQASKHIETLNSSIVKLIDDIEKNGQITISIKGVLSEAMLLLGDFDFTSTDDSGAEEDSLDFDDIDVFDELKKRVVSIENLVLGLNENSYDEETIKSIFRDYHTLKGEAGFSDLAELSEFCHKVESAMEPIREKQLKLTKEITDIMLYFVDVCKSYIESAQQSTPAPDKEEIEQQIETIETLIEGGTEAKDDKRTETTSASTTDKKTDSSKDADEFAKLFPLEDEEGPIAQSIQDRPVDAAPPTGQKKPSTQVPKPKIDGKVPPKTKAKKSEKDQQIGMGMDMAKVDSLVEITGELTILYQTIKQSSEIINNASDSLTRDLDTMGRLFKELQSNIMSIRMTPIAPLFNRLNRVIRDTGRQEKKNIEVKLVGTNTVIDKNLMEDISGGLVHLVRNAVGHGIEPPRERIGLGKPEKGTITIKAFQDANNIVLEVSDDGRGISKAKVIERAIKKGLITSSEGMSEQDVFNLIFSPGFSTMEKVTGLAGRGVGMDVVKSSIEKARGSVEINSQEGKGMRTKLVLPFTFSIIEGLIVRYGKDCYIIPLIQVHEMLKLEPENIKRMKDQSEFLDVRGKLLPLVRFENLFNTSRNDNGNPHNSQVIVSIESDRKRCALLVDEVVSSQEIVLKELKGASANIKYISAAGILSNRKIGLVLDATKITSDIYSSVDDGQFSSQKINKRNQDQIEAVEIGTNQVAMIDFYIKWKSRDKEENLHMAINAFKTREFIPKSTMTTLPKSPKGFAGMINLRGNTVPVFSLSKLLMPHLTDQEIDEKLIIVCEFGKKEFGFLVTGVNKVNYISWSDILPPPATNTKIKAKNVIGTILRDKDIIFVVDFEILIESVAVLYDTMDATQNTIKVGKHKRTILIVEDSEIIRKKMKSALNKSGIKVIEAVDGKEGLDMIDKFYNLAKENNGSIFDYIDLVITDIEMPRLDGYTLTKTIKTHPELRVLPVLLHSSLSNNTIVQRAKEVKADSFITKCDPKSIFESINKYL